MNLIEVQDNLKNLSDQQLAQEMQMPSGNAPQYLVLSELQRRQDMRKRFQSAQAKAPATTVAEDALAGAGVPQGGIAQMARSMAPQSSIAQNTGIGALAQPPMPSEEPQRMAGGGIVRHFAEGRTIGTLPPEVLTDPVMLAMANRMGKSVQQYFTEMDPAQAQALIQSSVNRAARDKMVGMEPGGATRDINWVPEDYVEPITPASPFDPVPVGITDPNALDFTPVNPSYVDVPPENPVFPNEPVAPEAGPLFEPAPPLYPQVPTGNPIPGQRPDDGGYYDQPPRPEPMSPMDRIRAEMEYRDRVDRTRDTMDEMAQAREQERQASLVGPAFENVGREFGAASPMDIANTAQARNEIAAGPPAPGFFDQPDETVRSFDPYQGRYVDMPTVGTQVRNIVEGVSSLPTFNPDLGDPYSRLTDAEIAALQSGEMDPAEADRLQQARIAADSAPSVPSGGGGADAGQAANVPADTAEPESPEEEQTSGGVRTPGGNIVAPADTASTTGIGALPGVGAGGSGSSGVSVPSAAPTSYEQQLIEAMGRAEKRAKQDKWMALAQAGMALMSSKEPTLMGALGEAGIAGLKDFKTARDEAENTRLGLEKSIYDIRAAQAAAAQRASGSSSRRTFLDDINTIDDLMNGMMIETTDELGNKVTRVADGYEGAYQDLQNRKLGILANNLGVGVTRVPAQ